MSQFYIIDFIATTISKGVVYVLATTKSNFNTNAIKKTIKLKLNLCNLNYFHRFKCFSAHKIRLLLKIFEKANVCFCNL